LSSPAVGYAKDDDSRTAGDIEHAVENEFLEACGAPITSIATSRSLAVVMLQSYNAARIPTASGIPERNGFVSRTMAAVSEWEVDAAMHAERRDVDLARDQTERARVGMLSNTPR
jgi:hypothetical protein